MHAFNIALATVGLLILVLGLFSGLIKNRLYLSEPLLALVFGLLMGPAGFNLLQLSAWGNPLTILEQAARLTLGLTLVGTALRLPDRYFFEQWRSIATLLTFGMLSMWLISGFLVYWLLDVPVWSALLLGAVVTPTDPVLASAIVTGKVAEENIPARVRHLLSAEAGANDGLAFLLVAFPLLCLTRSPGEALHHWVTRSLLREVLLAVVVGVGIGYAAGRLQQWIQRVFARDLDYTSLMTVALALSVSVLGVVPLLGGNGILATFAAGVAFNSIVHGQHAADQERIQEQVKRFFDLPVFVLLGSTLPWSEWQALGWNGVLLAGAILLLRRMPALLVLRRVIGQFHNAREALLTGWFGPIGIAALFYATLAVRQTEDDLVWVVGSLLICASIVAHGISATPLTKWWGRQQQLHQESPQQEK
jgi:NhaP-type Na+/H+ or K+/H+ antiporter